MVYRKKQWRSINKQRISRLFRNHKKSSRIDKIRNLLRKGEQMKKGKGTKAILEKVRQLSKNISNISREKNIVQSLDYQ